jgi:dethiobiotin synthetase
MTRVVFITGTDTGVGKTVLSILLTRYLIARGINVTAVKPFSSGNRDDARALRRCQADRFSLDFINPWHFHEPLSPAVAAAHVGKTISPSEMQTWWCDVRKSAELILVEGAGGLLSPLTPGLTARHLIVKFDAIPLVVTWNRLGALNQARLVWEALPQSKRKVAGLVLNTPSRGDLSTKYNSSNLQQILGHSRIFELHRCKKSQITMSSRNSDLDEPVNRFLESITSLFLRQVKRTL